ncbi:MAG: type II secretion system F family protein [Selenomonadaceae bacterium]|nr:type II secretion system F family protein [Selenomonadaceae bacterium]MDY3916445.1 type II secretion system F family protein [Selenomonadaceae bacterium]
MRALIALLVMVGSFLICYAIIHAQQQKEKQLVEKLENFSHLHQPARQRRQTPQTRSQAKAQLREHAFAFVRRLAQNWQGIHLKKVDYDLKMQQAGWPLLGKEFQMGLLVLAVIGAVLLGVMLLQPVWALVGAASGVLLGLMLMNIAIARRQKAFANQLGDMLTMTSNALRAGFSFMQAVEMISREMDDPIGGEFAEVMREMRLGASLEKALVAMTQRVQSKDFELVVTAVLIQRQVGGNLAQILDTISETVEDRIRMRREIKSLTAQGRASGVVLAAIPPGLAVILSTINPDYLQPLLTEDLGHIAIAGAIVMEIIGFYVINRIVNIEV